MTRARPSASSASGPPCARRHHRKYNLPRFVSVFRDRHGKARYRFRRKAKGIDCYLKSLPGTEAFEKEYLACLAGKTSTAAPGVERAKPGSLSALIDDYYGSTEYRGLADATKATYRNILERLRSEHGDRAVARLKRPDLKRILAEKADTPSAHNSLLKLLSILMKYAQDMEWRPDDPTLRIKRMRTPEGGHHVWTEAEVARFEEIHPPGTMANLALKELLCTGQRRSDAYRMGWPDVSDGCIAVVQQKTNARLEIPLHPELARAIAARPRSDPTFLLNARGRHFASAASFGNRMREWCDEAGLPECSAHGLRHLAAHRLAEAGATPHQIKSITGHKSLREVERYTEGVNQRRLSKEAMAMLLGTGRGPGLSNPPEGLDTSPAMPLAGNGGR